MLNNCIYNIECLLAAQSPVGISLTWHEACWSVKQAEHLLCVLFFFPCLHYKCAYPQGTRVLGSSLLRWMSTMNRGCIWHLCAGQVQDNYHLGHLRISKLKEVSKVKNGHSLAWCSGFESWLHIRDTWELWNTTQEWVLHVQDASMTDLGEEQKSKIFKSSNMQ